MRNLILFGPFLWLRMVLIWILILLSTLSLGLYIVVNSSIVVQKSIDTFAPDYNITYENIEGSIFSGLSIQKPKFNDTLLADTIVLKWNPNLLAVKKVKINTLHIKKANIESITALLESFSNDTNQSDTSTLDTLPVAIDIQDLDISLAPFIQNTVSISTLSLNSKNFLYQDAQLQVEDLDFVLESNVSNIYLKGKYENRIVQLDKFHANDVNLTAILKLFGNENNQTTVSNVDKKDKEENLLLPQKVFVHTLDIHLLPYTYKPFEIEKIVLQSHDLVYDISTGKVKEAQVKLYATSNLTTLDYEGTIQDNHLLGPVILRPKSALYTLYNLPLRKKAISKITIDLNASTNTIIADIHTKAKQLLAVKTDAFNVDVTQFQSHVIYNISKSKLNVETKSTVDTPYAKHIKINNSLFYADGLRYHGFIDIKQFKGMPKQYAGLINHFKLNYKGNTKSIQTSFVSDALQGTFVTKDFKKAQVHIATKNSVKLASLIGLPKALQEAVVQWRIDAPLTLRDLSKIDAKIKVNSNLINMDANVRYGKNTRVDAKMNIPKNSLLKQYNSDVKWEGLSPLKTIALYKNNALQVKINAKSFYTNVGYNVKYGHLNGRIKLAGLACNIRGNTQKKLNIQTNISSLERLGKDLNSLYDIGELPPIRGNIKATLVIDKLQSAKLNIVAPKLIYKADKKTKYTIEDVHLVSSMDADKFLLKSYKVTYNKQKYFSTKEAKITLGETMHVSNFWLNDTLKIEGQYTPKKEKGKFTLKSERFHIHNKIVDIYTKINSDILLNHELTMIKGDILLLEGKITPQVSGRTFAGDSDIVILQQLRKKKKSSFLENLNIMLQIKTKKPLLLKQKLVYIKLKPALTISKNKGSNMLFLGDVTLLKGSTYKLEDKKIILKKSHIYLTGNIAKPILDIKAKYKSLNHLITIGVTGTPTRPRLDFSAAPTLTREQILSVLLFDTEAGGDTHSGIAMMKMMGGAMAKAALAEVGVKVDHLVFGEGNSIEVGKKLTKKMTVIYINAEVPKVKLKYKHNRNTESVVGVSEESQSYDIIFKKDF